MQTDTFGSPKQFKMLDCLTEKINLLDRKGQAYFSNYIGLFHTRLNGINAIKEPKLQLYLLGILLNDYVTKTNALSAKYEIKLISHLLGFIHGRINESRNTIERSKNITEY
jgi:hypothetical protein